MKVGENMKETSLKKCIVIIVSVLLAVCILIVGGVNISRRYTFFKDAVKIEANGSTNLSEQAETLSQKAGITFNENVSAHLEILSRYDDVEVLPLKNGVKKSESSDGKIKIYTETHETDYAVIHFALIDGVNADSDYQTVVYQLEWKEGFEASIPTVYDGEVLWDLENDFMLCFYGDSDTALKKELNTAAMLKCEYYPRYITPADSGVFGANTSVQMWGSFKLGKAVAADTAMRLGVALYSPATKNMGFYETIEWVYQA